MKEMIIIYDLADVFYRLEIDVIRFLVDSNTLGLNGYTVNDLKLAWVEDRLEEMRLLTLNQVTFRVDFATRIRLRELSRDLDRHLCRVVEIPNHCYGLS